MFTISIYLTPKQEEMYHLFSGHQVDNFLTHMVEGWKGDPEYGGTMMYFNDDEGEQSREMKIKVKEALDQRQKEVSDFHKKYDY